jgi:hypothetical protein
MRKGILPGLVLVAAAIIAAAFVFRPDKTIRVATGLAAKTLCSDVFISGLDPATVYAQAIEARPGVGLLARNMHFHLDQDRQEVRIDYFGHFIGRAVYRQGLGCLTLAGNGPIDSSRSPEPPAAAALLPEIAGAGIVEPTDARLRTALDQFFAEPAEPPHRWIRAVVVLKDGQVMAERYAPGIGVDMYDRPLQSWLPTPLLKRHISAAVKECSAHQHRPACRSGQICSGAVARLATM